MHSNGIPASEEELIFKKNKEKYFELLIKLGVVVFFLLCVCMCVCNVVKNGCGKFCVLACSLTILYTLYHFNTVNHDVHIIKAFVTHLI